jgi:hypothetical protein
MLCLFVVFYFEWKWQFFTRSLREVCKIALVTSPCLSAQSRISLQIFTKLGLGIFKNLSHSDFYWSGEAVSNTSHVDVHVFYLAAAYTRSYVIIVAPLLGAFATLRKATISFVVSVRPSARNNSTHTGRIFMKFDHFSKICHESKNFIKMWQK